MPYNLVTCYLSLVIGIVYRWRSPPINLIRAPGRDSLSRILQGGGGTLSSQLEIGSSRIYFIDFGIRKQVAMKNPAGLDEYNWLDRNISKNPAGILRILQKSPNIPWTPEISTMFTKRIPKNLQESPKNLQESPKESSRNPKESPKNLTIITKKYKESSTIPKESSRMTKYPQRISNNLQESPRIPKASLRISKNPQRFSNNLQQSPKNPQRIPKESPKNNQQMGKVQSARPHSTQITT